MTLQDIISTLNSTFQKLDDAGIDDTSKRDLHILILQLERELEVAAFDPLKDIDSVKIADTSQLRVLAQQVQQEIDNEKARVKLLQKMIATAKVAVRAAGVHPSIDCMRARIEVSSCPQVRPAQLRQTGTAYFGSPTNTWVRNMFSGHWLQRTTRTG